MLVEDSLAQDSFPCRDGYARPPRPSASWKRIPSDARRPNNYLEQFPIGLKGGQHISGGEVQV